MSPRDRASSKAVAPAGAGLMDQAMSMLAALLGSDPRPSLAFAGTGGLILANPAAGAAMVAEWHSFSHSPAWRDFTEEARHAGAVRIVLASGARGELNHLALEGLGRPEFFLLRLDPVAADDAQGENLEARSERLTSMAHDLRAPLQALILATDTLQPEGQANPALAETARLARLALDRVRNLLEMTRLDDSPGARETVERFDLVQLASDMLALLAPLGISSGNRMLLELAPKLKEGPAWYAGPAHLIRSMLQNLISNADRFTSQGQITLRLALREGAGLGAHQITFEVEDNGIGMPQDLRDKILRPGGGARLAGSAGGYGLGLGIVLRALERMRGQMEIEDGKEGGTLFRLSFPLSPVPSPDQLQPVKDDARLDGARILVVEDNPINLAILLRSLTDAGAEATGVLSGEDALRRLQNAEILPDLVVMDVSLPDINGIEVTKRLRASGAALMPIVGLTAHDGASIHGACLAGGMSQVLVKPVSPVELRHALRMALIGTAQPMRVKKKVPGVDVFDDKMVSELREELGTAACKSFMAQAVGEAQAVLEAYRGDMASLPLRQMIHSAIGSAGLTGLSGILRGLRRLQDEVRADLRDPSAAAEFQDTIVKTLEAMKRELA